MIFSADFIEWRLHSCVDFVFDRFLSSFSYRYVDFEALIQEFRSFSVQVKQSLEQVVDISMTPSEDCKSNPHNRKKYSNLMRTLNFSTKITPIEIPFESRFHDFVFDWAGKSESDSYQPLCDYLNSEGIISKIVSNGNNLPNGKLYEVDIYSLKPLDVTSDELRKEGKEPRIMFQLSGTTDLVTLRRDDVAIVPANIKYYVEVKTVKNFKDSEAFREAILQLIGGNVDALYHSPLVLLTNLVGKHYVFSITEQPGDTSTMRYTLNTFKFTSFAKALGYVENMSQELRNTTYHFCRKPTPPSTVRVEDFRTGKSLIVDTGEESDVDDVDKLEP